MTPLPTGSSAVARGAASMFNNTQNTYIAGGSFSITTNNTVSVSVPSLDVLHIRAAPNAILNAGGRADDVRCHPGTRKEVIGRIEMWRDAQDSLTPPMFWLSGPAGAGKTAIMQTIAERCIAEGVPQANFFFFRNDTSRHSVAPLMATLVHQVIQLYPSLWDLVATLLSHNPLILDATLEDQLRQLIVIPLEAIRQSSSSYHPPLLLIDGLDECESENKRSQRRILQAFDKVLVESPYSFRLLVASRDESQIQMAFNGMSSQLLPIYLDNHYFPEGDIRAFVNDEFKRVRKVHPLAHTLNATWPSVNDVEGIVQKSSGHFIYAATVMRFISESSASPTLSLARVQGAVQFSSKSPFSHLDTIYTFILSQVDDQEVLKDLLHAHFLIQDASQSAYGKDMSYVEVELAQLLEACNAKYTKEMVQSCLADLTPIAHYADNPISWHRAGRKLVFHHASFPDYLRDQSRSKDYFVDIDMFKLRIQPAVREVLKQWTIFQPIGLIIIAYSGLYKLQHLPPGFLHTLIELDPLHFNVLNDMNIPVISIFRRIYDLCACDDDVTGYKLVLRQWIYTVANIPKPREFNGSKWPPCSRRYLAMARIERHITTESCGEIGVALCPETDSDTRETTLWLNKLLHRIYRENNHTSVQDYDLLLQAWISWAAWNGVPLNGLDDPPDT